MRDIDGLVRRLNSAMSVLNDGDDLLGAEYNVVNGQNLYEFTIWCNIPDRPVYIGAINLDDWSYLVYVDTNENIIRESDEANWLMESDEFDELLKKYSSDGFVDNYYIDKYFPAETMIDLALSNILYDLDEFTDFELYIYSSLKRDYEKFIDKISILSAVARIGRR